MIFFNINLVLQSELSPEKEKGHPDPYVRGQDGFLMRLT